MVLSEQLRGAIENGEIQAYFQPLVRARDMRVVGFETLGRWFHPGIRRRSRRPNSSSSRRKTASSRRSPT